MKKFHQYLAESERTYQYRIKIAGSVPQGFVKDLESKFAQFDVVKIGDLKTTPVRKQIPDFPGFPNESMSIMDVEFRYPAIEPQIKQLAQILGLDPDRIVMNTVGYEDSLNDESKKIQDDNKDLLKDTEYPTPDQEQKGLKKDYSAEPHDHVVLKNAYRSDFTVAGGKTPAAKTTNELPMGNKSPISNIKRPPKPATGAQPRG
jgi:hypothetical protein